MSDNENTQISNSEDKPKKMGEEQLEDLSQELENAPTIEVGTTLQTENAKDLEAVYEVPVKVTAVLGKTKLEVNELLQLMKGNVITLDRKIGEAIDIFVNNRLIARGEVVVVNEKLGVTMTEIIKVE